MNFITFIHKDSNKESVTFKKLIDQKFEQFEIQTHQTFNSLKARAKKPSNYDNEIFILFADSRNRLEELTSLIDLLDNRRLILILPENSKATLSIAHQFFPRYFTFADNGYDDLCAVINKMTHQKQIIQN